MSCGVVQKAYGYAAAWNRNSGAQQVEYIQRLILNQLINELATMNENHYNLGFCSTISEIKMQSTKNKYAYLARYKTQASTIGTILLAFSSASFAAEENKPVLQIRRRLRKYKTKS